jgi:hypothetical protein
MITNVHQWQLVDVAKLEKIVAKMERFYYTEVRFMFDWGFLNVRHTQLDWVSQCDKGQYFIILRIGIAVLP